MNEGQRLLKDQDLYKLTLTLYTQESGDPFHFPMMINGVAWRKIRSSDPETIETFKNMLFHHIMKMDDEAKKPMLEIVR